MKREEEYKKILRNNGFKATAARLFVFDILANTTNPISAKDIYAKLSRDLDFATVYRILNALVQKDLVHQIDLKRGYALYELAENSGHHHHLVCERCAKVVDLKYCDLSKVEKEVAAKSGFALINEHSLEFFGVCAKCASL